MYVCMYVCMYYVCVCVCVYKYIHIQALSHNSVCDGNIYLLTPWSRVLLEKLTSKDGNIYKIIIIVIA